MINQVFDGILYIGIAIALLTGIVRARKDKQLKITLIDSGSITKVQKVILKGKGLTIAITSFGIGVIVFAFIGISTILSLMSRQINGILTIISVFLLVLTLNIAAYITTRSP